MLPITPTCFTGAGSGGAARPGDLDAALVAGPGRAGADSVESQAALAGSAAPSLASAGAAARLLAHGGPHPADVGAAWHGGRAVLHGRSLLSPAPVAWAGVARPFRPWAISPYSLLPPFFLNLLLSLRHPRPKFEFVPSLLLVTATGPKLGIGTTIFGTKPDRLFKKNIYPFSFFCNVICIVLDIHFCSGD